MKEWCYVVTVHINLSLITKVWQEALQEKLCIKELNKSQIIDREKGLEIFLCSFGSKS